MQLLFKREQSQSFIGSPHFKLWAKIELDQEEKELMAKYQMFSTIIIHVEQPQLTRTSYISGFAAALVAFLILFNNFYYEIGRGMSGVVAISALIGICCGFVYYHQMRETIYASDLSQGRYFKCRSVVDLARREAYVASVVAYMRQVLESAKHWGGAEVYEIPALPKEEALRVILKG